MKVCDYVCSNCKNAVPIDKFIDEYDANYNPGWATVAIHKPKGIEPKYICGLDYYPFARLFTNLILWAKAPQSYCSSHESKGGSDE